MGVKPPLTYSRLTKLFVLLAGFVVSIPFAIAMDKSFKIEPIDGSVVIAQEFYLAEWKVAPETRESYSRRYFEDVLRPSFENRLDGSSDVNQSIIWQKNANPYVLLAPDLQFSWVAIQLENPQQKPADLILEARGLGVVSWYIVDDDQQVTVSHVDDLSLRHLGRPVFDTSAIIPLNMLPGEKLHLYLGFSSAPGFRWELNLWKGESFREHRLRSMMINGLYFGLVVSLIFACLIAFIGIRDPVYLFFALFLTSTAATVFIATGLFQLFLLQDFISHSFILMFLATGSVDLFSAIFSILLLKIHRVNRTLYVAWLMVIFVNLINTTFAVSLVQFELLLFDNVKMLVVTSSLATFFELAVYIWTLVVFWQSSIVARYWFLVIFFHSLIYILWTLLSAFPDVLGMDLNRFVQAATLLDAIFLAGILAYTLRTQKSERLMAQELSIENLRLARDVEQAKSNFVSTVSHDLHGPVRAIGFFAESLKETMPQEGQLGLQRIRENVETVSTLLNSMTRLSEVDAQRRLVMEETPLSKIFYTLKNEFDPVARGKNLALNFPDVSCGVQTDPVAFSQILRNLIENAIKYTTNGSVDILVKEYDNLVSLSVADTGKGISARDLRSIFDEFYQVSQKDGDGVGLGLSICARLTKLLNIEINVSSAVHKGSRFELRIPKIVLNPLEAKVIHPNIKSSLSLIGAALGDDDPRLVGIAQQLQAWGVNMIQDAKPVYKVDFVLVAGGARGVNLAKDYDSNVWVLVVGSVDDFDFSEVRHIGIATAIEPMQLRAIMQRILKSVSS